MHGQQNIKTIIYITEFEVSNPVLQQRSISSKIEGLSWNKNEDVFKMYNKYHNAKKNSTRLIDNCGLQATNAGHMCKFHKRKKERKWRNVYKGRSCLFSY